MDPLLNTYIAEYNNTLQKYAGAMQSIKRYGRGAALAGGMLSGGGLLADTAARPQNWSQGAVGAGHMMGNVRSEPLRAGALSKVQPASNWAYDHLFGAAGG